MSDSMQSVSKNIISKHLNIFSFALISAIFYLMAYYSVSDFFPRSIPVHHDDYTNYSSAAGGFVWSWIRPLSTGLIFVLSAFGSEWLIWAVRILTVTYIFLCWKILVEVLPPRQYWVTLVLFAMAVLSTPIVAEYARYTGMVTHMMSGCLGLAAVYFLFKGDREGNDSWFYVSIVLLLLSTLAKEDFILAYMFSFAYVLFQSKTAIKKRALMGSIGLVVSLLMVASAKFLATSSFLGEVHAQSSYFIDTSVAGVASTVWRYLTGAGHPAMKLHGQIIAAAMIFSCGAALIVILRDRSIPKTIYIIGLALTLMAPYSVLPNHVNAYYEMIWLPFVIGSVYVALAEVLKTTEKNSFRVFLSCAIFAVLCVLINVVDAPRRSSIALWYDSVGSSNAKLFRQLEASKNAINASSTVCVYGADAFSPWYMHSGQYLEAVLGLHTVWNIVIDQNSPLFPGFQQGAASSKGRFIVSNTSEAADSCLKIKIDENK